MHINTKNFHWPLTVAACLALCAGNLQAEGVAAPASVAAAFSTGGTPVFIDRDGTVIEVPDEPSDEEESINDLLTDLNAATTLDINLRAAFIDHQSRKVLRIIHRNQDIEIGGAFTSLGRLLGKSCLTKIKGKTVTATIVFSGVFTYTKILRHTFTGDPDLKECDLSFYGWHKTVPDTMPLGALKAKVTIRISGFNLTGNRASRTVQVAQ